MPTVPAGPAGPSPARLRLVSSYPLTGPNPYWRLFYQALAAHGVECTGTGSPSPRWLADHPSGFDIFHVHYAEHLGRFPPPALTRLLALPRKWREAVAPRLFWPAEVLTFRRFLRGCRVRGVRLAWTMHNLESHERSTVAAQVGHKLLARYCDLVICHSHWAADECRRRYAPRGRVVVMPHGNYDGAYGPSPPRAEVLGPLRLDPARPVVGCIGRVRGHKGTDLVCEAVARLGGRVQLLIAGDSHPDADPARLRARVAGLPAARWVERRLTDDEYAAFTRASDAVLLPYRQITGSGSLLAALTLGRGVVATDLPYFREVLGPHPAAGVLFRAGDPADLAAAVDRYLAVPAGDRERAARGLADAHAWNEVIRPVAAAMAGWAPAG